MEEIIFLLEEEKNGEGNEEEKEENILRYIGAGGGQHKWLYKMSSRT